MAQVSPLEMSESFKSAISSWISALVNGASDQTAASGSTSHPESNPFVGQTVNLDKRKLRIEKVIAEGELLCTLF